MNKDSLNGMVAFYNEFIHQIKDVTKVSSEYEKLSSGERAFYEEKSKQLSVDDVNVIPEDIAQYECYHAFSYLYDSKIPAICVECEREHFQYPTICQHLLDSLEWIKQNKRPCNFGFDNLDYDQDLMSFEEYLSHLCNDDSSEFYELMKQQKMKEFGINEESHLIYQLEQIFQNHLKTISNIIKDQMGILTTEVSEEIREIIYKEHDTQFPTTELHSEYSDTSEDENTPKEPENLDDFKFNIKPKKRKQNTPKQEVNTFPSTDFEFNMDFNVFFTPLKPIFTTENETSFNLPFTFGSNNPFYPNATKEPQPQPTSWDLSTEESGLTEKISHESMAYLIGSMVGVPLIKIDGDLISFPYRPVFNDECKIDKEIQILSKDFNVDLVMEQLQKHRIFPDEVIFEINYKFFLTIRNNSSLDFDELLEIESNTIGHVLVYLPSYFEGGNLSIGYGENNRALLNFSLKETDLLHCRWLFLNKNTNVTLTPITNGNHSILIYSVNTNGIMNHTISSRTINGLVDPLTTLMKLKNTSEYSIILNDRNFDGTNLNFDDMLIYSCVSKNSDWDCRINKIELKAKNRLGKYFYVDGKRRKNIMINNDLMNDLMKKIHVPIVCHELKIKHKRKVSYDKRCFPDIHFLFK